jgi:hypothetical protein
MLGRRRISAYCALTFLLGLGGGVLWSPLASSGPVSQDARGPSAIARENEKCVQQMGAMYGKEAARFAKQFEGLTIHIKEYPLDAAASPDGRFVIRLFGTDETIASELYYPVAGANGVNELVRDYSFSWRDRTYSCYFARSADNSAMNGISFSCTDGKGGELSYLDTDADGRWDTFVDRTNASTKVFVRQGLRWKQDKERSHP